MDMLVCACALLEHPAWDSLLVCMGIKAACHVSCRSRTNQYLRYIISNVEELRFLKEYRTVCLTASATARPALNPSLCVLLKPTALSRMVSMVIMSLSGVTYPVSHVTPTAAALAPGP